jgi:hypothetical protein
MTIVQWETFERFIYELFAGNGTNHWHDGDCIGADAQAHGAVARYKTVYKARITLVGHPCYLDKFRANLTYDITRPIHPPIERNHHIVDESDVMIATPQEYEEVKRKSGTWASIRYTGKREVPLFIIWPDGSFNFEPKGWV